MIIRPLLATALLAGTALGASAETLRWARAGDALTLDPTPRTRGPRPRSTTRSTSRS